MVIRPVVLNVTPSIVSLMLGGLVGGLLALSVLYSAPIAGWPALDVLRALGGIFAASAGAALAVGAILYLLVTALAFPVVASAAWMVIPGWEGLAGDLVKAVAVGAGFWIVTGVLLGLAALAAALPGAEPGFMGFGAGVRGGILFAIASLGYGIALAFISYMEQGISPLDAIGWVGFSEAAAGPTDLGAHRAGEPPAPGPGERPWRGR